MISINVKDRLDAMNMNRNQFARECKIGYPAACEIYKGENKSIRFDTLEAICKALNCTPNDILISDDPQMQRLLNYAIKLNTLNKDNNSDTK